MKYEIIDENGIRVSGTQFYLDEEKAINKMIALKQRDKKSYKVIAVPSIEEEIKAQQEQPKQVEQPKVIESLRKSVDKNTNQQIEEQPKKVEQVKKPRKHPKGYDETKFKRLDILMDLDLFAKLSDKAKEEYTTPSRIIIQAVLKYLEK